MKKILTLVVTILLSISFVNAQADEKVVDQDVVEKKVMTLSNKNSVVSPEDTDENSNPTEANKLELPMDEALDMAKGWEAPKIEGTSTGTGKLLEDNSKESIISNTTTSTGNTLEQPPVSHLQEKGKVEYTYYYGKTCSHCIEINKFFKERSAYDNFNIVKKEAWSNKENAAEHSKKAKELGYTRITVPFIVVNNGKKEFALSGTDEIREHFTPLLIELKKEIVEKLKEESKQEQKIVQKNKTAVLIALLLVAVVTPVILIRLLK